MAVGTYNFRNGLRPKPVDADAAERFYPTYIAQHPREYLITPISRADISARYGEKGKAVTEGLRLAEDAGKVRSIHGSEIEDDRVFPAWARDFLEQFRSESGSGTTTESATQRSRVFYLPRQEKRALLYAKRLGPLGYDELDVLEVIESHGGSAPVRVIQKALEWEEGRTRSALGILQKNARLVRTSKEQKTYTIHGVERTGVREMCTRIPISELR